MCVSSRIVLALFWQLSSLIRDLEMFCSRWLLKEEEFRRRREAMVAQQRREAVSVLRRLDEMRRSQLRRPATNDSSSVGLTHPTHTR